jgi:hypothetical protein
MQRSLGQERVGERSFEDFIDPLKVPVAQRNSKRPLPPLAMLAATSPGTRRGEESPRASSAKRSPRGTCEAEEMTAFSVISRDIGAATRA